MTELVSALGLLVLVFRFRPWRKNQNSSSADMPLVSIIIPCRNEEKRIATTLKTLIDLEYPNKEIIVVDDQSTDNTAEIIKLFPVKLIKAPLKPEHWAGKNWACWAGANVARGELFLFTDADTSHFPLSLQAAVNYMKSKNADMISAPPFHQCKIWFEKLIGLFFLFPMLATAFRNRPSQDRLYAIGQYMLVDQEAYFNFGGHEAIACSLVDDIDMASLVLSKSLRYFVYPFANLYKVQMFESAIDFMSGWIRLLRLGLERSRLLSFVEMTLVIHLFLAPIFNFTITNVLIYLIGCVTLSLIQKQYLQTSPWTSLLAPLSILVFTILSITAALSSLFGKSLKWRGRMYSSERIKIRGFVFFLFFLGPVIKVFAMAEPITFKVEGLRSQNGQVAYTVFKEDDKGFPDDASHAVAQGTSKIDGKEVVIKTKPLEAGKYGIAVMHDEDGDSKFKTGPMGIPREGFGFSNNPRIFFGPPSLSKVLINHQPGDSEQVIKIKYFL